jgi:hypothetical protein
MDGKGAWRDNVFVERLWRSVKYEEVYLRAYDSVSEARTSIGRYFNFYNGRRPHSSLDGMTPDCFPSIRHSTVCHLGRPLSVTSPLTIALAKHSFGKSKSMLASLFGASGKRIQILVAKVHLLLGASCERGGAAARGRSRFSAAKPSRANVNLSFRA